MKLNGKHILITGSLKRIGRAITESFIDSSNRLSLHYYHSTKDAKAFQKAHSEKEIKLFRCNLESVAQIQKMSKDILKKNGPVDILIHNAADFYPTPLAKCREKDWDHFIALNLKSTFFLNQFFAPRMKEGVIIHICDVFAEKPLKDFSPYVASKGGLRMLSKNLALELAPKVRVCSISPGTVLPPSYSKTVDLSKYVNKIPLDRIGEPQDIVSAVHFILGNDYLTGIDLKVDGGKSLL